MVTSPTGTIDKQALDNAEPRTPKNTTATSFRWSCEQMLKSAVLSRSNHSQDVLPEKRITRIDQASFSSSVR
jgi:hypothetical protein